MIKDKLKEIRENIGMNKKEFANCIGIKYTTYNGYETGAREPDSDFLILIAKKFDVSTDYILGLRDEKDIANSYQLKSSEYKHIEKYRQLDPHGKDMVDTVLNKEYQRSIDTKEADKITQLPDRSYLDADAAHDRTDIPDSDRTAASIQAEDDIMDDPNF